MKKSVQSTVVLVAICAVMAILLALTNAVTAPIIKINQDNAANEALLVVMPDGEDFKPVDISGYTLPSTVTEVYKEKNGGYVFRLNATGFQPDMIIMCGINADGIVTGSVCLSSNETWGKQATFGDLLVGVNKDTLVDVEAGATSMTINGYRSAIQDALNAAVILGGGEADLRSPEEIFADNLKEALPSAEGEFVKQAIADKDAQIDFIYVAKNGAGYVYVIGDDTFIGIDAEGNLTATGYDDATIELVKEKVALAASHTKVDTTDSGINKNITSVQKTEEGNYVIEVNGLGFAYFGDESHYVEGKNIPIQICVVISPEGVMLECLTVAHQESSGYGAVCGEESYYGQFDGKTESDYKEVDAIGGATITTNGYMKAIERCFDAVKILEGGEN